MTIMEEESPYLWVVQLSLFLGYRKINEMDKPLVLEIDKHWTVKCNGKPVTVDNIPPLGMAVEFNGWPAGVITLYAELLCAGDVANIQTFKSAIINRIKKGK